jgi:hypothetical protein
MVSSFHLMPCRTLDPVIDAADCRERYFMLPAFALVASPVGVLPDLRKAVKEEEKPNLKCYGASSRRLSRR